MRAMGRVWDIGASGALGKNGAADIAAAPGTDETAAPPAVDNNLGAALLEGGTVVLTSALLNVVDAESPASAVTYTITVASANGTLFLNGSPLGVGGTFTQDDINNGRVRWTHDGGETVSDSFSFDVMDGDGESTTGHSFGFDVTPVNDAPVVDATARMPTFTEAGAAVDLFRDVSITNAEADQVLFVTFVLSGFVDGGDEVLTIGGVDVPIVETAETALGGTGLTYQITFSGGVPDTVVVYGLASGAAATTLVDGMTYRHDGLDPVEGTRSIRLFRVTDDGDISNGGERFGSPAALVRARVSVEAVDQPGVAHDDAFSGDETAPITGDLFADNGSGADTDPDGDMEIVAVNGDAASVGQEITLASGATLRVNDDGTFTYTTPTTTPETGAGASNGPLVDTFTYTLAGGDTATVTITASGIDNVDILIGTNGADAMNGGVDDDVLRGLGGNDALDGGDGLDTADYSGAAGGVEARLDLGTASSDGDGGSDTLANIENLTGSASNDYLVGDAGDNTIEGGDGDDVLIGRAGDDLLVGGLGMDALIGQEGDDVLVGGSGAANQLQGGLGDDTYVVTSYDTIVEFDGEGEDTVQTTNAGQTLTANVENLIYIGTGDFIGTGNDLNNVVMGGAGNDVLMGRAGSDVLMGQGGNDTASYALAWDRVVVSLADGTASDDGDGGSDVLMDIENLTGSDWDDDLFGDAGVNVLNGGAGDDLLAGGAGNDVLRGGDGFDIADYTASTAGIVLSLNTGVAHDGLGGTDLVISVEEVWGSAYNDVILGGAGDDLLSGEGGRDVLVGGGGDDVLIGGDGDPNQLQGGLGDDRYLVTANDTLVEFVGEGHDTVVTTLNAMTLRANFEDLQFIGDGNFVGIGNAEDNVIVGGDGDDILTGGAGDDFLVGFFSCGCNGGGTDMVLLSGNQADYEIEELAPGQYQITDLVAGRDGIDILIDIDRVRFADGVLNLADEFEPRDPDDALGAPLDQTAVFGLPDHMLSVDQVALLFAETQDSGRLHDWMFQA